MFHFSEERVFPKQPLSSGGFGSIYGYEPKKSNGKQWIIKEVICDKPANLQNHVQEIVLSSNHNSPFILSTNGFNLVQNQQGEWVIRMKMPRLKGSVRDYIANKSNRPFNLGEVVRLLYRIAYGLKQLQNVKISHRDMKPDNILLDKDNNAYIADLGLGRLVVDETEYSQIGLAGTLGYFPPETNGATQIKKNHLHKIDLWNLGLTMYEVCLFNDLYLKNDLKNKPLTQQLPIIISKVAKNYGPEFAEILAGLLCPDPEKRISFDTVCELLEKSFSDHLQSTFDILAENIRNSHRKVILDRLDEPSESKDFIFHFDEELTVKPKNFVDLNSSVIEDLNKRFSETFSKPLPEVLQIDFSWCKSLDDNSLKALNLQNIKKSNMRELKLDFTGCSQITDRCLTFLDQANLRGFEKLESLVLDFSECNIRKEGLERLLENVKPLFLKKLSVRALGSHQIKIEPGEAQEFANKIGQLTSLKTLRLDISDLSKLSKRRLKESLSHITDIEVI